MRASVAVLALLTLLGCSPDLVPPEADPDPPRGAPGTWTRLPDSPLSARQGPVVALVDGQVVVVGGSIGRPCPPAADCAGPFEYAADGATYDPGTQQWRRITDAPRPVLGGSPRAVAGDQLFVLSDRRLMRYDRSQDTWSTIATPARLPWHDVVSAGPRLLLVSGSDEQGERPDHVLDLGTGDWTTLPEDPLSPSFDRVITPTPHGLVLTALPIAADGGPEDPALVEAAILRPGSAGWTRLPDSEQLGGWRWTWTGQRLVDPSLGGSDGGEVNGYGRTLSFGGRLDPAAGRWSQLPGAPEQGSGGWPVEAEGGPVTAAEGWLYDDAAESWTELPAPEGAPEEPGSAVWAQDLLVVVGGSDWDDDLGPLTAEDVYSTGVWGFRVPR